MHDNGFSLDPAQASELQLRAKEVDRLYTQLRHDYHLLKHKHDEAELEAAKDRVSRLELEQQLAALIQEKDAREAQIITLRQIGDEHLLAFSQTQAELAAFLDNLPSFYPKRLDLLLLQLKRSQDPSVEQRIQQDRLHNTERMLAKLNKEQLRFAETQSQLRNQIAFLQSELGFQRERVKELEEALEQQNNKSQIQQRQPQREVAWQRQCQFYSFVLKRLQDKVLARTDIFQSVKAHCQLIDSQTEMQVQLQEAELEYRVRLNRSASDLLDLKKNVLALRNHLSEMAGTLAESQKRIQSLIGKLESESTTNDHAIDSLMQQNQRLNSLLGQGRTKLERTRTEATDSPTERMRWREEQKILKIERDREKLHKICNETRARLLEVGKKSTVVFSHQ